jgi:hypothetical protein
LYGPIPKSLQSQRDGLFVEELIPKPLQSQRDGLFVEELIPKFLQSQRDGLFVIHLQISSARRDIIFQNGYKYFAMPIEGRDLGMSSSTNRPSRWD